MSKEPTRERTPAQAMIFSGELEFSLRAELDMVDITAEVAAVVTESGLSAGTATIFVPGATGAITCLEFEPGVVSDFQQAIERLAPRDFPYEHDKYQADGNGHAHVRAGFIGPSLAVPFQRGELILGVWQQITLINCDNRARQRKVFVQLTGV